MAIVRDCGDFTAKIGFSIGVEFPPHVTPAVQSEVSGKMSQISAELQSRRERMEMELLDYFCEQLGYPEERVRALVDTRTTEESDAIEKEAKGREEKNRRRSRT